MSDDQGDPNPGLVTFRLFGFPVSIHGSFLLIIGIFGLAPGQSLRDWGIWMVVASLAILVHELGHAVVARLSGAAPAIALVGLGGVTTFVPTRPNSRATSIAISAAGPGIGLVIGGALYVLSHDLALTPGGWQDVALGYALFTTLAWSVLNLLPALPLDGGHILQELLPGAPHVRLRRAAITSIVVAVGAGIAALLAHFSFFGIFAALLVLTNVMTLRALGAGGSPSGRTEDGPAQAIVNLVVQGRYGEARQALTQLSQVQAAEGGPPVDLALHGLVMAVSGERDQGIHLLVQEVQRRPGDPLPVRALGLAHVTLGEFDQFGALLSGAFGRLLGPDLVIQAQDAAIRAEQDGVAARLGETFLADLPPSASEAPDDQKRWIASVALQTARARARARDVDRAVADLRTALSWGFSDAGYLRGDPAFAALRHDPRFEALVASLGAAGGSVSE